MTTDDPLMARITAAVTTLQQGDPPAARKQFGTLWDELEPDGDPLYRCILAHYAADAEEDPAESLRWNQRALDAAAEVTDERARQFRDTLDIRGFAPSLHLNLAEDHRRLGDLGRAREHLREAKAAEHLLADDGYGALIRSGITRMAEQLAPR
jgi:hypothetical protein